MLHPTSPGALKRHTTSSDEAASVRRVVPFARRIHFDYCRPRTSAIRSLNLGVSFPAVRSGARPALDGERLSAAAQRWPSASALPRQTSVDGPSRRSGDGERGCWAM